MNCTIRLAKRRSTRARKALGHGKSNDLPAQEEPECAAAAAKRRSKRVSAREWWDGNALGKKYSKSLNELVCRCSQCGMSGALQAGYSTSTGLAKISHFLLAAF